MSMIAPIVSGPTCWHCGGSPTSLIHLCDQYRPEPILTIPRPADYMTPSSPGLTLFYPSDIPAKKLAPGLPIPECERSTYAYGPFS